MDNNKIYIYKKSHLPSYGWFQGCFVCKIITANHMKFDTIHYNKTYHVYMCAKCERSLIESANLYNYYKKKITKFILLNVNK